MCFYVKRKVKRVAEKVKKVSPVTVKVERPLVTVEKKPPKPKKPNFYWPTQYKVVTQAFGVNPQYYGKFGLPGHEGIDFRAPRGSEIYCVWDGVVKWRFTGEPESHAYGKHIRVEHTINGIRFMSIYAHLDHYYVMQLDDVKRGQLIGLADDTGNSVGSHLHFGLKQYSNGVDFELLPDTEMQKKFNPIWDEKHFVDPTLFFKELRDGYE